MKKDMKFLIILAIVAILSVGYIFIKDSEEVSGESSKTFFLLDTAIQVDLYGKNTEELMNEIQVDLEYYHKLTDKYNEYEGITNVYTLNKSSEATEVDPILFDLIKLSKDYYELSNGKFNIAFNNVLAVWHDYREEAMDGGVIAVPYISELEDAALNTLIEDVILNEDDLTVELLNETTIDLGASAKGFIAALLAEKIEEAGITEYIINAGGNVVTGLHPDDRPWRIGLEDPNSPTNLYARVELINESAVTSGDYQRFYLYEGERYHHIIDPLTLYPAKYYRATTVITSDHAVADILSTTLYLMPLDEAEALVESLDGVEAIWYHHDDTYTYSSGFEKYLMTDE
jgi:thiamine biosynthesis lipoprotein